MEQNNTQDQRRCQLFTGRGADAPGAVEAPPLSRELSLRQARMLAELRIEIGVELGEVVTSADRLIDLVPGNTLEFKLDEQRPLTLRLYGEYLGTGRLIRDGDGVSLEIISLAIDGEETFAPPLR